MQRIAERIVRLFRRSKGASATDYGLIVGLIAVALLVTLAAMGGSVGCTFSEIGSRISGQGHAACYAANDDGAQPPDEDEDAEPPLDMNLNDLAFADSTGEPGQYVNSREVRVFGFSGTLQVSLDSELADAQAQINVAGQGWGTAATIANGQSLRLRMTASTDWGDSRVMTVTVGEKTASWTVHTRAQDTTIDGSFAFRPTPYSYIDANREDSPTVVVAPPADVSPTDMRMAQARFGPVAGMTVLPSFAPASWGVGGFDGPMPLQLKVNGLEGAVPVGRRNNNPWPGPEAATGPGASEVPVYPNDQIGVAVWVPAMAYKKTFAVTVTLGDFSADWTVKTRPADGTPDPVTFPDVTDLPLGDGSTLVTSTVETFNGLEIPSPFALAGSLPAGAAMRVCSGGGCSASAADGSDGWSAWATSATVCDGCKVQLHALVPSGYDGAAELTVAGGDESDPFTTVWTASTVTDGPDAPEIETLVDAEPDSDVASTGIVLRGTVKPVTVSVPAPATIVNGAIGDSSVTVNPGDSFTVQAHSAAGFKGEADDTASVPLTVTGLDSQGNSHTWSAAWTPPAAWKIVNRVIDSEPDDLDFEPVTGQDPGVGVDGPGLELAGFDRTLTMTVAGPAGSGVAIQGGATIAAGSSGPVAAGQVLVPHVTSSATFGAAVTLTVTVGSKTGTFTAVTRPQSDKIALLDFQAIRDLRASTSYDSETITLTGFDGALSLTVSGPTSPQFRVGNPSGWSESSWTAGSATVHSGDRLQLRASTGAGYSTSYTTQISAGSTTGHWIQATMRDALEFDTVDDAPLSATVDSNKVKVTGLGSATAVTLNGDPQAVLVINGTASGRSGTVSNNDELALRTVASATLSTSQQATVTLGARNAGWTVITRNAATAPSNEGFPWIEAIPGADRVTGQTITLAGMDGDLTATVLNDLNAKVSIDGGAFGTGGTVHPGSTLQMQVDRPYDWNVTASTGVMIGTKRVTQVVHARQGVFCFQPFSFSDVKNVANDVDVLSNEVTVGTVDGPLGVGISATATTLARVNRGDWASTVSLRSGDRLQLKMHTPATSNSNAEARAFVGPTPSCYATWKVNPQPPAIAFADALNRDPGAGFAVTGSPGPVTGLAAPVTVSVSGSLALGVSVNGGAAVASATVANGDTVRLVGTAPAGFDKVATALIRVANVSTLFTVTTRSERFAIDGLTFVADMRLELGVQACHPPLTVTGFDAPKVLTVSGAPSATLSVNGASPATSVTVSAGQTLTLCFTTPSTYVARTVPGVTYVAKEGGTPNTLSWVTQTRPKDVDPDPFDLEPFYGATPNQPISTTVNATGFDETLPARAVAAGPGNFNSAPSIRVNGGAAQTGEVQVKAGDEITLTQQTAPLIDSWSYATLSIGARSTAWQVYTGPDNIPDEFDFDTPDTYNVSTDVVSNTVTLSGFAGTLNLSLSGNAAASIVLNGTDTHSQSVGVVVGDRVALHTVSSASFGATQVTTALLGPYASDTWEVRTRLIDNKPDDFPIAAVTGASASATVYSVDVPIAGFDQQQTLTVASSTLTNIAFSRDGGRNWAATGPVTAGDVLQFRATAPAGAGATGTATVTVGQTSSTWSVGTRAAGVAAFLAVPDKIWAARNSTVASDPGTVSGLSGAATLAFTQRGPGLAQLSVDGGNTWVTSAQVTNGTVVRLRSATSADMLVTYTTALTLGGQAFNWSITTQGPPVTVTPPASTASNAGDSLSIAFTASGGHSTPGNFYVSAGSLPTGYSLSSAGVLSGTSTAIANYSFTVSARDDLGNIGSAAVTWSVGNARPALFKVPTATGITVTSDMKEATYTYASGWRGVELDRQAKAGGKYYIEFNINNISSMQAIEVGFKTTDNVTYACYDSINGGGTYFYRNSPSVQTASPSTGAFGNNTNVNFGIAIDMTTRAYRYRLNGTWQDDRGSASFFTMNGTANFFFFANVITASGGSAKIKVLSSPSEWVYSAPTGYGPVNGLP